MASDNTDQADFWGGEQGRKWVTYQAQMDALFDPVLRAVLDLAALTPGEQVLDIGCGTGASSIAAARAVGPKGYVLGADISAPLLKAARKHADATDLTSVEFVEADAAVADLGNARFNAMISRFGVMFFAEPAAAFRHMSEALKPRARIAFACWGLIEANPWFTAPAQAAKAVLGSPEKSDPDAPGPFAMRDVEKLRWTLNEAGLQDIEITPTDILLAPPGSIRDVAELSCKISPAARTLTYFSAGEAEEAAVIAKLEERFVEYQTKDGLRIPAQINMVRARTA